MGSGLGPRRRQVNENGESEKTSVPMGFSNTKDGVANLPPITVSADDRNRAAGHGAVDSGVPAQPFPRGAELSGNPTHHVYVGTPALSDHAGVQVAESPRTVEADMETSADAYWWIFILLTALFLVGLAGLGCRRCDLWGITARQGRPKNSRSARFSSPGQGICQIRVEMHAENLTTGGNAVQLFRTKSAITGLK